MSVVMDPVSLSAYAAFPPEAGRDWLERIAHLGDADLALVNRRDDPVTRLGYAVQVATVRAIGTFQSDPSAVPEPGPVVVSSEKTTLSCIERRQECRLSLPSHS